MKPLEQAILRTVAYASVFRFPLTFPEIHHFLIHDEPVGRVALEQVIRDSQVLGRWLEQEGDYLILCGQQELVRLRTERQDASRSLWPQALRYGRWLARLPFVRMVAVTGALAMHNAASPHDDLDFMLVTRNGRVWTARAFAILVVRLARLQGVEVCPNYVLAECALSQEQHSLFMAHEVVQVVPVFGDKVYQQFRKDNAWVEEHLPNASGVYFQQPSHTGDALWAALKHLLEVILGGRPGDALERWEYARKLKRFGPLLQNPSSAAQLDQTRVKGHFDDRGHPALRRYHQILHELGLESIAPDIPRDGKEAGPDY